MVLRRLTSLSITSTTTSTSTPTITTTTSATTTSNNVDNSNNINNNNNNGLLSCNSVPVLNSTTSPSTTNNVPSQLSQPDLAGIFSVVFNRRITRGHSNSSNNNPSLQTISLGGGVGGNNSTTLSLIMNPNHSHSHSHIHPIHHHHLPHNFSSSGSGNGGGGSSGNRGRRWASFSMPSSTRSFWTKYCLLCTICGSASTILAGIFLIIAVLFRYYTTSIYYFETVPTYIPAILLSICGVSTIAFSCKRNRNIILLRITACWSLVSAALSSVITITTSLIHMNRLQTLKECVYNKNPPSCTCFGHSYGLESVGSYTTNDGGGGTLSSSSSSSMSSNGNGVGGGSEPLHFVFENTIDCDVIHGVLYSCLRAVFAVSVVAVLLSIFLCMLLYQLIGHERKKAYWSRIRRINSDWNTDFLACLPRTLPREQSGLMPLILTPSTSLGLGATGQIIHHQIPSSWGPPPPYEPMTATAASTTSQDDILQPPTRRTTFNSAPFFPTKAFQSGVGTASSSSNSQHTFIAIPPNTTNIIPSPSSADTLGSNSPNLNTQLNNSFPFSPTITSLNSVCATSKATMFPCSHSANALTSTTTSGAPSSSTSYHLHRRIPSSEFDYDDRQQQVKLDRRNQFIPQILLQQQMTLRESKISISSDSDNLYSIDEDLFKEPNRDKDLETKINNQIMSLLLLEEEKDAAEAVAGRLKMQIDKDPMEESSSVKSISSLVTLQNDDDVDDKNEGCKKNENFLGAVVSEKISKSSSNATGNRRNISSLPSSPFLNNMKKYFRQRTNSLRLMSCGGSPIKSSKGSKGVNYTEFSGSNNVHKVDIENGSHINPNYSYDDNDNAANDGVISNEANVLSSSITLHANNESQFTSNKKVLKSQSLPSTPKKRNKKTNGELI